MEKHNRLKMLKEFNAGDVAKIALGLDPMRSKLVICQDEYNCFKIATI